MNKWQQVHSDGPCEDASKKGKLRRAVDSDSGGLPRHGLSR